ncbi:hypothetical protein F4678DRAFT_287875 [Xylaria arbuscula]|nr:hypothetical protein F4678DRAFT_287875 [Xylaria arbuscula]
MKRRASNELPMTTATVDLEERPVSDPSEIMAVDSTEGEGEEQQNALVLHNGHGPQDRSMPPARASTLLPRPMANAVSLAARSTSFALRIGTAISGYGLTAAKVTTLSSLELGRGILDGILNRAGRDVFVGTPSDLARADAESILESNLESMHQTMSRLVFWTAAGFHAAGTTVSTASNISQLFLSVLDQFFGSTDSSRAIASIITLVRREFQNPATGVEGEQVGVVDLILGLCGLAYLQNRCQKMILEESRRLGYEEIIWDIIVLNNGERVDALHDGARNANNVHSTAPGNANETSPDFENRGSRRNSTDDEDDLLEAQLRKQIAKSLPKDAKISISTSTTVTKTITVDITGASCLSIPSFPNLGLVSSEVCDSPQSHRSSQEQASNCRVVYKVSRNRVQSSSENNRAGHQIPSSPEELNTDHDELSNSPTSPGIKKLGTSLLAPSKFIHPIATSPAKPLDSIAKEDTAPGVMSTSDAVPRSGDEPSWESRGPSSTSPLAELNERTANQKRLRQPLDYSHKKTNNLTLQIPPETTRPSSTKTHRKTDSILTRRSEKKPGIRGALGKGSVPTLGNLLNRDPSSDGLAGSKSKQNTKPPWGGYKSSQIKSPNIVSSALVPDRASSIAPSREAPRAPQRGNPNYFSSRDLGSLGNPAHHKSPLLSPILPRADHRRGSLVSLTDTISVHSYDGGPPSPPVQTEAIVGTNSSNQRHTNGIISSTTSPQQARRPASRAHTPSIYTLATRDSETSLAVSSFHTKSAYADSMALDSLRRSGEVRGMFPAFPFLRNITRFSRYASAIYGYKFLKLMGISKDRPAQGIADEIHHDVRSFAHHAKLPPDRILLASFVDPQGGSDSTGSTDTGIPLVHTVSLDEESKAVVLTCRGTLGFEDVLADMMCDYDDLSWRGKTYKVHKGIHASARRLLYGGDGRVLFTIKAALEEYSDYGLVLCGHSLGGAVTALLGVMLAEPSATGAGFLTSAAEHPKLIGAGSPGTGSSGTPSHICLPSGRPIHVFAYGPPATMSPSLQKATRGLITSTVHGNDIVPYLSLGVLHDFQALALAFKTDNNEAKAEVKRRVWEGLRSGLADKWYRNPTKQPFSTEDDEHWGYVALKTLRVSLMSSKLLPPGEVFKVESSLVMRRDAFTEEDVGRPATRIVLKYIRDVEAHFREVRFGASMLTDHSPGRYEDALRRLHSGVVQS